MRDFWIIYTYNTRKDEMLYLTRNYGWSANILSVKKYHKYETAMKELKEHSKLVEWQSGVDLHPKSRYAD
jgi:hypothetical protein